MRRRLGKSLGQYRCSPSPLSEPRQHGSPKNPRSPPRSLPGRCFSGCPFPFTRGPLPTAQSLSFSRVGGPTPGTTRATDSSCCLLSRSAWASRPSSHGALLSRSNSQASRPLLPTLAFASLFALAGLNVFALLRAHPIVYVESTKNARRAPALRRCHSTAPADLLALDPRAPVLMNTSLYPEIVAFTGIPLRQTINESDLEIYRAALASPATHAASSSPSMATRSTRPSKRIPPTSP